MAERSFIDTNILVYAEATDEPVKQQRALALLKRLHAEGTGVLSTQVLQEYANVALKKLKLPPAHVRAQLQVFAQFEVVQATPDIIQSAVDLVQLRSLSFYDALIVAAAIAAGCSQLYSEDMNSGEQIRELVLVNPLREPGAPTAR